MSVYGANMSELEEANRKFQETQEKFLRMSRDLQESKARLEEAQRVAHVVYWIRSARERIFTLTNIGFVIQTGASDSCVP